MFERSPAVPQAPPVYPARRGTAGAKRAPKATPV